MYAKLESDITSLAIPSPTLSPKASTAVYYVQSPSCDSHEEDNSSTSASCAAMQVENTSVGVQSPSVSLSPLSLSTRSSAATQVSGAQGYHWKRSDRERIQLLKGRRHAADEVQREGAVHVNWGELSKNCKFFMGGMLIGLVFAVACFIVWVSSGPFTAQVFLKVN